MDAVWEAFLHQLTLFKLEHGDFDIPLDAEHEMLRLWAERQSKLLADGLLPPDRRQRLEELGLPARFRKLEIVESTKSLRCFLRLESESSDKKWRKKYDELVAFRARFGHCYVPHPWPEQPGLGLWVKTQREHWEAGTLEPAQIALLDAIQFIWKGGWEVLGPDWPQKQKAVMGKFYRDPNEPPDHFTPPPHLAEWARKLREMERIWAAEKRRAKRKQAEIPVPPEDADDSHSNTLEA